MMGWSTVEDRALFWWAKGESCFLVVRPAWLEVKGGDGKEGLGRGSKGSKEV